VAPGTTADLAADVVPDLAPAAAEPPRAAPVVMHCR
jgi:hypothetical protein